MTKTAQITVTINGVEVIGDIATIASLLSLAAETPSTPKKSATKAPVAPKGEISKPREKSAQNRAKHDQILDSKRVDRMVQTAIDRAKSQGFECKSSKQGKWVWLYPVDGRGRTPEFKSIKLAKGWKHSPKRGAFYRDFS